MIIKNFLSNLKISKYTYLIIILCFVTGLIKELLVVLFIIIFHEFGHYVASHTFKWKINKINIYPFGGLITYNDKIDKPLKEEFIVTISGPINQYIIYLIVLFLNKKYLLFDNIINIYKNYNYSILIFNLLPIIPLDGSKLMNIVLNKIFNFRLSYKLLIIISVIFLIIFTYFFNNSSYILVISFLIYEIYRFIKDKNNIYNRFILEKYLYKNNYNKYLYINNIKKMKRNKKHIFNNYLSEKEKIKKEYYS